MILAYNNIYKSYNIFLTGEMCRKQHKRIDSEASVCKKQGVPTELDEWEENVETGREQDDNLK